MIKAEPGNSQIRSTIPADVALLVELARETGVFKPHEIVALGEVLDDYFGAIPPAGHCSITYDNGGRVCGFAYYAFDSMTDGTWTLWWIAVHKALQAQGLGRQLLAHVENDVRARGARHLLIETSSLPYYELTRRFYLKYGYDQVAVVPEYYAAGDDQVVFRKRF